MHDSFYLQYGNNKVSTTDLRGRRSNYFDGLGSSDYFCGSNHYFLPVTLDPITFQFH